MTNSTFTSRIAAIVCSVLVSTACLASAVGPAMGGSPSVAARSVA